MSEATYRIGEVAEMLRLKTYVLRFWETEFPQLEPLRTEKGQRLYTEENVRLLRRIQYLLHEQGMTIDGARRVLAGGQLDTGDVDAGFSEAQGGEAPPREFTALSPEVVHTLRDALLQIRDILLRTPGGMS